MFKNSKKKVAVLVAMMVMIGFSGCTQKAKETSTEKGQSSIVDKIKKSGKIVVGTSGDYPPYEFHKSINGKDEIVGFDIEIAKQIAKDLGVQLEIKDMKFDGLLPALDSGNVDFLVAGMTPTEERKKNVDFSKIYYTAVQKIVVRAEDKDKFQSMESIKGKRVGVQKGAIQEQIANNQMQGSEVKALGKISDLILSLKSNKVDSVVVEGPVANSYVNANKDLIVSAIELKTEESGSAIAVKKGNSELVEAMNKTLDRLQKEKAIEKFVTEATEAVE